MRARRFVALVALAEAAVALGCDWIAGLPSDYQLASVDGGADDASVPEDASADAADASDALPESATDASDADVADAPSDADAHDGDH